MASGVYVTKAATSGTASPPAGYPMTSGRYTPSVKMPAVVPSMMQPNMPLQSVAHVAPPTLTASPPPASSLQAEIARRQAAEARVRELEAMVAQLQQKVATLEGGGKSPRKDRPSSQGTKVAKVLPPSNASVSAGKSMAVEAQQTEDPIDRAICEYLERNPDFPVSIQKVAHNYYVFGDRGTVYATQRGDHVVVRVGGGYKSLQVFMDERSLMVTGEAAGSLADKGQAS